MSRLKRKPIRDIDLLFYKYCSYYDKNDDYIVEWKIDWTWIFIAGFVTAFLYLASGW